MAVKWLSNKRLIEVVGAEASAFLQGLITNDIGLLQHRSSIYAFILNVKGRIVHDVFVHARSQNRYLLEVDGSSSGGLERMLKIYRLRQKISISTIKLDVGFSVDGSTEGSEVSSEDPRVPKFGLRLLGNFSGDQNLIGGTEDKDYLLRRLEWGIAEGPQELTDQIPLNANGDLLNGISFDKGCYIGQELIARTHHTGVVRRRIVPFKSDQPLDQQQTVVDEEGRKQGRIIRSLEDRGLALVPIKSIKDKLFVGGVPIQMYRPKWWPEDVVE